MYVCVYAYVCACLSRIEPDALRRTVGCTAFIIGSLERSIPDVLGRRLRFAQPAVEGEYVPLLNTKYKPDVIETDRDIEVGICMDRKH